MPLTLVEKLIAKAAARANGVPGEIVICRVDLVMAHDFPGARRGAHVGETRNRRRNRCGLHAKKEAAAQR